MDEYREYDPVPGLDAFKAKQRATILTTSRILYKKASSRLPNWPKGPNDFYVAILSHEKHVRSCEHKDLLWLKVRGVSLICPSAPETCTLRTDELSKETYSQTSESLPQQASWKKSALLSNDLSSNTFRTTLSQKWNSSLPARTFTLCNVWSVKAPAFTSISSGTHWMPLRQQV